MIYIRKHFNKYFLNSGNVFKCDISVNISAVLKLLIDNIIDCFCDIFLCFVRKGSGNSFDSISHHYDDRFSTDRIRTGISK